MSRKRNLLEELDITNHTDSGKSPLDIDIQKIKDTVKKSVESKDSERKVVMKSKLKWTSFIAAAVLCVCVITLNTVPEAAYALSDVPIVKNIVKVVTFGRYEMNENGYSADIKTPKIEGLLDEELQDRLNKEFKDNADALIAAYENDVKELKEEFGDETIHMGVESDYIVRTDNDRILSLDVYIFNVAGSSSTKHTFYNIDKKENKLLSLEDLFKEGADYITPVSAYIKERMKYENENNDGLYWIDDEFSESFEEIAPNQNFYINDKNELVICFDKYEVAAGAQGCPEFVIPKDVIGDIYKGV